MASSLPSEWSVVLDQIERGLEQTVLVTMEREAALQAEAPATESFSTVQSLLQRGQALREGLESFLQRTEQNAADVEALLEAAAESAQRWLEEAAAMRHRLAEEARRAL